MPASIEQVLFCSINDLSGKFEAAQQDFQVTVFTGLLLGKRKVSVVSASG